VHPEKFLRIGPATLSVHRCARHDGSNLVRSTSTPSYLRRPIQDRQHSHNLRSTRPLRRCVNLPRRRLLQSALIDALLRLFGTRCFPRTVNFTVVYRQMGTSFGRGKGGNVTSAGWQVTLCDPIRHVSSRSGVETLRTAIHLLLTYLLTLPKTVINLVTLVSAKDIPLLPGFLSSLFSVAYCLAPALLRLRPYGAIQTRLFIYLFEATQRRASPLLLCLCRRCDAIRCEML